MDSPEAAGHPATAPDMTRQTGTFCPRESRRFVLISAILASSMGFIDGSVVALAMPAIRADLGASLVDAQWINNGYMLFLSALVLLGGAAGDVFGVRRVFGAGIALFVLMSLACALAPDSGTLIVLRAAQGVGAAFMVPGSLAIIAKSYPAGERGAAIGTWAAASSLTTALGPFVGGLVLAFGEDWMWRVIFAINGPIGLVALYLLFFRVPPDRPETVRRLDVPGAVLATGGLGLITWGLTAFGVPSDNRIMPPIGWIVLGAMLAAGFVWWEKRAREPMVKLALFRSRAFSGANVYTAILFFAFGATLFFVPMTLVSAWGAPEWKASLMMLPLSVFIGTLSGRMGRLADARGPRLFLTAGAAIVGVAFIGLALTAPLMMMWSVTFPFLALMGFGMSVLVSPLSTAVMQAAPDDDSGLASGINNAVARSGSMLAVAALGALAGIVFDLAMGGSAGLAEFGARPDTMLDPAAEELRIAASNMALQAVVAVSGALCLLAALVAWFTQPSWNRAAEATA